MKKLMLFVMFGLPSLSLLVTTGCQTKPPTVAQLPPTVTPTTVVVVASATPTSSPTSTATSTPTITPPRSIYAFATGDYSPAIMDWDAYLDTISAGNLTSGGSNGLPFTSGSFVPQSGHSYILVFQYDSAYPPSPSDTLTAGFKHADDNSVAASGMAIGNASVTVTLIVP